MNHRFHFRIGDDDPLEPVWWEAEVLAETPSQAVALLRAYLEARPGDPGRLVLRIDACPLGAVGVNYVDTVLDPAELTIESICFIDGRPARLRASPPQLLVWMGADGEREFWLPLEDWYADGYPNAKGGPPSQTDRPSAPTARTTPPESTTQDELA